VRSVPTRAAPDGVTFAPFRLEHADELVPMWRASFEHGVGVVDPNPLDAQRDHLLTHVVPNHDVRVAQLDGAFVRNRRACAFYERHGFVPIAYGFEPTWRLDDVEYEWRREGASSRAR
jgi:hypothetical protein